MGIIHTGGDWNPSDWPTYFVASNVQTLRHASPATTHMLVAVNELHNKRDMEGLHMLLGMGKRVLIDSGVFWLSTQHAKKHSLSMDQALSLAPDQVDDFDWLFEQYTTLLRDLGDKVWGYIEIDQGGRENKIRTRTRLEGMGFRPIPVYHPFNDGWDYFDYLAERYDRICFGNVVQADTETRKRLVATAWERRRKYPHLWIHMLGLTASERSAAYPLPSCDSSTWLSPVRWGAHNAIVGNKRCWSTGLGLLYDQNAAPSDPNGHEKARRMAGYEAEMMVRTMRGMFEESVEVLGLDIAEWKQPA